MTQTLLAPPTSRPAPANSPWTLVIHGKDPLTGLLATWHALPLLAGDEPTGLCSLERVDGQIDNPAVWMQAHKDTTVVTDDEVVELLRQVSAA